MNWLLEKDDLGNTILKKLKNNGMILTWYKDKPSGWTLKSNLWSPVYINLRNVGYYPMLLNDIGSAICKMIYYECPHITNLLGVSMAGIPIATATSLASNIPMCYTRKIEGLADINDLHKYVSTYGDHKLVEGLFNKGDNFAIVDDLVTKLDSKLIALEQLKIEAERRDVSFKCDTIIVLLDREQGAQELAEKYDMKVYSLIPLKSKGMIWLRDMFSFTENVVIPQYLNDHQPFQTTKMINLIKNLAIGGRYYG